MAPGCGCSRSTLITTRPIAECLLRVTVYSRSELKREADKRGLVQKVEHKPLPGTDKSKFTTRWT